MTKKTILLYGRTGSGKTTQIGELAEFVYKTLGKKTRLATADRGGLLTLIPYVNLGIIEPVEIGTTDPWIFLNRVVRGYIRDSAGKWILDKDKNSQIGLFAFESTHGIAQLLKLDMERKAALGINIGGDTNTTFQASGDGENIKIGTTKGFQKYSIPQARIQEELLESQKLDTDYILWTSGVDKGDDDIVATKIIGPEVIGRALTSSLPRDFNYTIRIDVVPAQQGKPERHLLYLGTHTDVNAGGATALGNVRLPLGTELKNNIIEPASIVKALEAIQGGYSKAEDDIRKRLGL